MINIALLESESEPLNDPEAREASVFLLPSQFKSDQFDDYEKAIEFMKSRGWE